MVPSFKDSPGKPLGRRPSSASASDDDVGEGADALAHGVVVLARLQELLEGHEAVPVQVHLLKRETGRLKGGP